MLKVLLAWCVLYNTLSFSQTYYETQSGEVSFFSKAPFTDILGETNRATASIDLASGLIEARIPVNSFVFEKSLMQKHFNERYIESSKFPIASFKGRINERITTDSPKVYSVNAIGFFLIHGVSQQRKLPVVLTIDKQGAISVTAKFKVKLEDHKIEIPTLLFKEVTEEVDVSVDFILVGRPKTY